MRVGRFLIAVSCVAIALMAVAHAAASNEYVVTVLVSNLAGVAPVTDMKLVNGWGVAASPTSPWWVADNGTGWSTIYTGAGAKAPLEVTVPGAPTGIVAYTGNQFLLAPDRPARFSFASQDGTFSAWNRDFDPTHAHVVFSDPGSVYQGLAILGDTLYTSDFTECAV